MDIKIFPNSDEVDATGKEAAQDEPTVTTRSDEGFYRLGFMKAAYNEIRLDRLRLVKKYRAAINRINRLLKENVNGKV